MPSILIILSQVKIGSNSWGETWKYIAHLQKDCLRHAGSVNTIWRCTRLNNVV